jgi:hypothetical protein
VFKKRIFKAGEVVDLGDIGVKFDR